MKSSIIIAIFLIFVIDYFKGMRFGQNLVAKLGDFPITDIEKIKKSIFN